MQQATHSPLTPAAAFLQRAQNFLLVFLSTVINVTAIQPHHDRVTRCTFRWPSDSSTCATVLTRVRLSTLECDRVIVARHGLIQRVTPFTRSRKRVSSTSNPVTFVIRVGGVRHAQEQVRGSLTSPEHSSQASPWTPPRRLGPVRGASGSDSVIACRTDCGDQALSRVIRRAAPGRPPRAARPARPRRARRREASSP